MSGFLYRLGHASARHPWRVIAAWIVVAVSTLMLNSSFGGESDETFRLPGADSQRAADALADRFPEQTLFTSNVVFHAPDGLTNPEATTAIQAAVERLAQGAHIISVDGPLRPPRSHHQCGRAPRDGHGGLRRRAGHARHVRRRAARDPGRRGRRDPGRVRRQPGLRERPGRRRWRDDRDPRRGRRPGGGLRLRGGHGPSDRCGAGRDPGRLQHPRRPRRHHLGAEDRHRHRADARPRGRHRLRAVHPDPAPPEPRHRHVRHPGCRPGQRHRRASRWSSRAPR